MFRNHPHPDIEKLADFRKFIKRFGLRLGKEDSIPTNEDFQRLIREIHGKPYENVVMLLALRTMQQAKYGSGKQGSLRIRGGKLYALYFPYSPLS